MGQKSLTWIMLIKICYIVPWWPSWLSDQIAFIFLIWVLGSFQECFTHIELIVHQRWAKTRELSEKPPDHL